MNYTYDHILLQARSKERLGRTAAEDAQGTPAKQEIDNLIKSFPALSKVTAAYNDAMAQLNTTQNQYSMGLGKVIGIQQTFNTAIENLVKNITFLEEYNKELNTTFKVGSAVAQGYAETIRDIGLSIGFSDKTLFKFAGGLNDLTNGMLMSSKIVAGTTSAAYRDSMFAFQAYAHETLGVSAEAATGFEQYAALMGTSATIAADQLSTLSKAAALDTGIDQLTAQHDILEGIGSLSEDIRLNYSKIPGSLEVAVLKAKALGFTMEQLDQVGESLMNIEQSVGQEMEYQLLTGKRLLTQDNKSFTNEFRLAKLTGNAEKEAELMGDILEQQGDTLRTNYMARKKFAEMSGISDKELSAVLAKDKIAKELGVSELRKLSGTDLKNKVDQLKAGYAKQGEAGKEQIKKLNTLMETQDIRTSHEKVVEDNLMTIANTIRNLSGTAATRTATPGSGIDVKAIRDALPGQIKTSFEKFKTQLDGAAKSLGSITLMSEIFGTLNNPISDVSKGFTAVGEIAAKVAKKFQQIVDVKLSTGTPNIKGATDALIIPDRGPILRPAKNDVIAAFRPNDVVHNTVNDMVKPNSSGGNMAAMIAVLEKTIRGTQQQNNNVNVTMDTAKLANDIAIAMQSVKVEAKIRTDDIYSSNRMNNRKNII